MTTPLRPCGRDACRLCNPRPIHEEPRGETLAELLLGAAMLGLVFILAFVLLPVMAS
jgi:hypothetical protein